MRCSYDLHIHSALSACADDDMTPNNIVNMALLKGLDIIAVTDHNSCGNLRAVQRAAAGRLLVLPGLEAATVEEVHTLCYFPTAELAEEMGEFLRERLRIKNNAEFFGRQLYMDENDNVTGEEELLLSSAADVKLGELLGMVKKLCGRAVFAHIDKPGSSILSNLGFIPEGIDVKSLEITKKTVDKFREKLCGYRLITNSDAHTLGGISEADYFLEVFNKEMDDILKIL